MLSSLRSRGRPISSEQPLTNPLHRSPNPSSGAEGVTTRRLPTAQAVVRAWSGEPCPPGQYLLLPQPLVIVSPAPGLPDLLRRPLACPLQSDIWIARRSRFRRLDLNQVLNHE